VEAGVVFTVSPPVPVGFVVVVVVAFAGTVVVTGFVVVIGEPVTGWPPVAGAPVVVVGLYGCPPVEGAPVVVGLYPPPRVEKMGFVLPVFPDGVDPYNGFGMTGGAKLFRTAVVAASVAV